MAGDIFISAYRKQTTELKFRTNLKQGFENRTPEDALYYRELKEKYEAALGKMPENQRVVF